MTSSPAVASTSAANRESRGGCSAPLGSFLPLLLRLALGLLFVLSGYMKLGGPAFQFAGYNVAPLDPLSFSFSIDKFGLGLPEQVVLLLAHIVPWMELLAGACLVLGLCTRGASLVVALLMVAFGAGIASLLFRGQTNVTCPCFGSLGLFCGKRPMGVCHLIRNGSFMLTALAILWMGPGSVAIDRIFRKKR